MGTRSSSPLARLGRVGGLGVLVFVLVPVPLPLGAGVVGVVVLVGGAAGVAAGLVGGVVGVVAVAVAVAVPLRPLGSVSSLSVSSSAGAGTALSSASFPGGVLHLGLDLDLGQASGKDLTSRR